VAHIHCLEVFGIMGEEFAFPVNIDQKMDEIVWTKNKDKVVEWEGQNRPTYFTPLQNRGLLNTQNGCLIILNLEKNDTGTYMLEYMDAVKKTHVFHHTFMLSVLDPPSEPETSCNVSGDDLVLRCAADFQRPLTYVWKFSNNSVASQTQELFISKKNVDASEKVACFIQFSQTEKSSEISFTQC
ncbi:LFA3 protein, partial [Chloroceryle aenea]|nr:LFA3 protein [Chloroceryle aenea]